ncbi:membrane-targeted effector domain-containing toxin [Pseudomonas brenneri]|uniref:membrane-targeted effector domain-containing toxin n=1 Tax=Pseudomonas brenneri TaxID=129817 RepID=UPI0028D0A81F|nr:membrane-targeted effector domain-containing toxin [Pseudomonas brenneri]
MTISAPQSITPQPFLAPTPSEESPPAHQASDPGIPSAVTKSRSSVRGLDNLSVKSSGIRPATALRSPLSDHFKVGDQQLLSEQYATLANNMAVLQDQQPGFAHFLQARIAQAFPKLAPVDPDRISFNRYRGDTLLSSEPLMKALGRAIREIHANPAERFIEEPDVRVQFTTQPTATDTLQASDSLHTLARAIANDFPRALLEYWTTPGPPKSPQSPLEQLLWMHKQQLSTLAALRVMDGTLSPASKQLVDSALRYPTLEERESNLPTGTRPGVYPITIDDGSEHGAAFAGAFMITSNDGSSADTLTSPGSNRAITLNEQNGPVVLYTPSEGFEEFATPALLRQALVQRLDSGGPGAELLRQSLPLPVQNRASPPTGDDLMLGAIPLEGDVLAEGILLLLKRQATEVDTVLTKTFTSDNPPATNPLQDPKLMDALDEAADWSAQVDGTNAMLVRNEKLAEKKQPDWLRNLSPAQETIFNHLESKEEKSTAKLASLMEKIPSLSSFSRTKMNGAIKDAYPLTNMDANQLKVKVVTQTRFHLGRSGIPQPPSTTTTYLSLSDLALKNPTHWETGESNKHTKTTMTLPLLDTQGSPILDSQGQPVILDTQQLKSLVNEADVGGEYTKLLEGRMAPDAESGPAADLRNAWKANHSELMEKEAFLAQLNPDGFQAKATTDTTSKRGMQWIQTILDYPAPTNRPQVDGQNIVANTLAQLGQPVRGTMVIGNNTDSSLVLYTPGAPDGLSFRELPNLEALTTLLDKKEWKAYTASRKSPIEKNDFEKTTESIKKFSQSLGSDFVELAHATGNIGKRHAGLATLTPIPTNIHDEMYSQLSRLLIDKADFQSTSSAEVATQSTRNKIMFGIEVATIFLDLLPVIGRGVSTGVKFGNRLIKAMLKTIRDHAKQLPIGLLNKGVRAQLYADFTTHASGLPHAPSAPLRPVFSTVSAPTVQAPSTRSLSIPGEFAPKPPIPPVVPSTSVGIRFSQVLPDAPTAIPMRDLSAYSVPEEVLKDIQPRADGIYQAGENWYIRFTDSTGINKPYQIDSAFKARYGQVNIVDPNAPLDAPKTIRNVAFMQSTESGEWRLSQLPGGNRRKHTPPLDEYMDRVIKGVAAGDFNGNPAVTGQLRRWFRRDMDEFYASQASGQMPVRPLLQPLGASDTPKSVIQSTLSQPGVRGLVFGEVHDEPVGFQFLIDQMQHFKNNGVTVIYLENAPFLQGAPGFGSGAYTPADAVYAWPRSYEQAYTPNSPTFADVIKAAEAHDIKVIGLEHRELTMHTDNLKSRINNVRFTDDRLAEFNYAATQIIKQTPTGEKFVALLGKAHINTYDNIPGVSELTGGVGISLSPSIKGTTSTVSHPPHTPPPPLKIIRGTSMPEPVGDIHIDYNIDKLTL